MKTSVLIQKLMEADPTGELECCIDKNTDIYYVEVLPSYYDGRLEILVRDSTLSPYYDVIGGILTGEGFKVSIRSYSFEDAIWDHNGEFKIQYIESSAHDKERYEQVKKEVEETLREYKEITSEGDPH